MDCRRRRASKTTTQVETVTLDTWAEREGVERVDFFWLDLQGSELAALKGAERLLSTATAVYTEVALCEQYEGEALYPELRAGSRGAGSGWRSRSCRGRRAETFCSSDLDLGR
jgi:hypothetical protein